MMNQFDPLNGNIPLYSFCIRYDRLKYLIDMEYSHPRYDKMDSIVVFIDINSIIKSYFKNTEYKFENYYDITSGLINICAHYRQFFKSRYGLYCYIHLVYSDITQSKIGSMFSDKYGSKLNLSNEVMLKMLNDNLELLDILVPYLPWIQYTKTLQFETGVMIYDIIQKEYTSGCRYPNLVITKDRYNYQLCSDVYDIKILRPKKDKSDDVSYAINDGNVLNTIFVEYTKDFDKLKMFGFILNSGLLPALFALSRLPDKGIPSYININKSYEILLQAVKDNALHNQLISDMQYVSETVLRKYYPKLDSYIVGERYKAVNLFHHHSIFTNTHEFNTYQGFINLVDDNTVKDINNKFFAKNPLDLNAL